MFQFWTPPLQSSIFLDFGSDKQLNSLMQGIDECGYFDHQQENEEEEEQVMVAWDVYLFLVTICKAVSYTQGNCSVFSMTCTNLSAAEWMLCVATVFTVTVQQLRMYNTIVSQVSTHGRLSVTHSFGLYGCLLGILFVWKLLAIFTP